MIRKLFIHKIIAVFLFTFALSACANNANDKSNILVYINNGAFQCGPAGKTATQTAALLTANDITVAESQCGVMTRRMVIAKCGAQSTAINIHRIDVTDIKKAQEIGFVRLDSLQKGDKLGYKLVDCK